MQPLVDTKFKGKIAVKVPKNVAMLTRVHSSTLEVPVKSIFDELLEKGGDSLPYGSATRSLPLQPPNLETVEPSRGGGILQQLVALEKEREKQIQKELADIQSRLNSKNIPIKSFVLENPPPVPNYGGILPTATMINNNLSLFWGRYEDISGLINIYVKGLQSETLTLKVGDQEVVLTVNNLGQLVINNEPLEPVSNWSNYPTLNNTITFNESAILSTIEGEQGYDLYFNNELLAKAADIQDIADWALYPALAPIDANNQNIINVGTIGISGLNLNVADVGGTDRLLVGDSVLAYTSELPSGAENWSQFPATQTVDLCNNAIENATSIQIGNSTLTTSAGKLEIDNKPIPTTTDVSNSISVWASYPASSSIDMSNNSISGADEMITNKVFSEFVDISSLLLSRGGDRLDIYTPNPILLGGGTINSVAYLSDISNSIVDISQANLWSKFPAIQNVDFSGNQANNITIADVSSILMRTDGNSITANAGRLLYNNQILATMQNVQDWANYGATNTVDLDNHPLGVDDKDTNIVGQRVIFDAGAFNVNSEVVNWTNDGGLDILPGSFNILSKNGTYGKIHLEADTGYTGTFGGLIELQANSAGASLSRISQSAGTIVLSAYGLDPGPFVVPGAVNILSSAGTGIKAVATIGTIEIASGTVTTVAGGVNVVLSSSNGVIVDTQTEGGSNIKVQDIYAYDVNDTEYLFLHGGTNTNTMDNWDVISGRSGNNLTITDVSSITGNVATFNQVSSRTIDLSENSYIRNNNVGGSAYVQIVNNTGSIDISTNNSLYIETVDGVNIQSGNLIMNGSDILDVDDISANNYNLSSLSAGNGLTAYAGVPAIQSTDAIMLNAMGTVYINDITGGFIQGNGSLRVGTMDASDNVNTARVGTGSMDLSNVRITNPFDDILVLQNIADIDVGNSLGQIKLDSINFATTPSDTETTFAKIADTGTYPNRIGVVVGGGDASPFDPLWNPSLGGGTPVGLVAYTSDIPGLANPFGTVAKASATLDMSQNDISNVDLIVANDISLNNKPFAFFDINGTTTNAELRVDICLGYAASDWACMVTGHHCDLSGSISSTKLPITNVFTYIEPVSQLWFVAGAVSGVNAPANVQTWTFQIQAVNKKLIQTIGGFIPL